MSLVHSRHPLLTVYGVGIPSVDRACSRPESVRTSSAVDFSFGLMTLTDPVDPSLYVLRLVLILSRY